MDRSVHRRRYRFELAMAALAATLTLLTATVPDWAEVLFGIEPDQGSGQFEVAVTIAGIVVTLLFVALARIEWRRLHAASSTVRP
jgi:hypothetical protein